MKSIARTIYACGADVALKVLLTEVRRDRARPPEIRAGISRGCGAQSSEISFPYDAGEDQGVFFMVTELVEGSPLGAAPLSPRKALDIAVQIASGLAAAHQAWIVHRDLKPANILADLAMAT